MHEKLLVKLKYTIETHLFNCNTAYITFLFSKHNCLMLLWSLAVICMLQRCTAA